MVPKKLKQLELIFVKGKVDIVSKFANLILCGVWTS
uniref:Uncharacterized protein n=1 Tax=viral metagenome TaxID=1070528 RepID=A0A6C0KTT5_9ZZZZ